MANQHSLGCYLCVAKTFVNSQALLETQSGDIDPTLEKMGELAHRERSEKTHSECVNLKGGFGGGLVLT